MLRMLTLQSFEQGKNRAPQCKAPLINGAQHVSPKDLNAKASSRLAVYNGTEKKFRVWEGKGESDITRPLNLDFV
jgi:hypothetical protein